MATDLPTVGPPRRPPSTAGDPERPSADHGAPGGTGSPPGPPPDPETVRGALRAVIDPEVGLDIVTLGLVYDVAVEGDLARVRYTLTTAGCPLQGLIHQAVTAAVASVPGIERSDVEVVWDPPWTPDRIADGAWDRPGPARP